MNSKTLKNFQFKKLLIVSQILCSLIMLWRVAWHVVLSQSSFHDQYDVINRMLFSLQTLFYTLFSCHQGRLAAQPMLSGEVQLFFSRSCFFIHTVTSCQNPSTGVAFPSYEKIICNLQLMLNFYFSLLCSFIIISFRIPYLLSNTSF